MRVLYARTYAPAKHGRPELQHATRASLDTAHTVTLTCIYTRIFSLYRTIIVSRFEALIKQLPPPPQPAWPTQHTHYEIQYTPGQTEWSRKDVHYDFDNKALRYDIQHLSGPEIPFITLLNFSSYWLADALYMVTWATPLDNVPTCIQLNLGFGMMKPKCVDARAQPGMFPL